jgi:transposase
MHKLRIKYSAIVHYINVDRNLRRVAHVYGVSKSTLARWVVDDLTIQFPQKKVRKQRISLVQQVVSEVNTLIMKNPYSSLAMLQSQLTQSVSVSTVRRCIKSLRLSYKATSRTKKGQQVNLDHPFFRHKLSYGNDTISIDEASYVSCDTPRRGWSKIGLTLHKHPPKRRRVVSLLLAIDRSGVVAYDIRKGSFNQHSLSSFIRKLPVGRTVLLDNVSFHKTALVREASADRDIQLRYTPPYCPWFNPTEFAFSVSKRAFRRLRGLRDEGAPHFEDDIRDSLLSVSKEKCMAFFDHSLRLVESTV